MLALPFPHARNQAERLVLSPTARVPVMTALLWCSDDGGRVVWSCTNDVSAIERIEWYGQVVGQESGAVGQHVYDLLNG